jgi:RNA polymerase sigma-70 factor (ECF subfamily)
MNDNLEQRKLESREEDRRLIAAALAGDQEAYARILGKYHDAISNLIYRMINRPEEVEDLTQEAFIKAFAALASFNDEYAFSTWLYKIATNNCIDYLRKRKLHTFSIDKPLQGADDEYQFEIADHTTIPDQGIIDRQQRLTIEQAIASLPEKYRRVIHMRHVQEKSYEDIALELDLPLGTVKAHIFRAREMLNKMLRGKVGGY